MNPDCRDGKHASCSGDGWDMELDNVTDCPCACHGNRPKRVQRKRTKGWRMPENTVYVGRGSKWGNPWKIVDDGSAWSESRFCVQMPHRDHGYSSLGSFRTHADAAYWAVRGFERDKVSTLAPEDIATLRGKDLACWCPLDQPCHADVLLELANQAGQS